MASEHEVVIMGDFNFSGINWNTLSVTGVEKEFLDHTLYCFFVATCYGTNSRGQLFGFDFCISGVTSKLKIMW